MEQTASVDDEAMLAKLRALAANGARLRREPGGTGVVIDRKGQARASLTAPEMAHAMDAGWLTGAGSDGIVLSRKGVAYVRRRLNVRAGEAAAAGSSVAAAPVKSRKQAAAPARPTVNPAESPLYWLRNRRDPVTLQPMISAAQFEAGERLRADFELAQLQPRVTASWNPAATGHRQQRGVPGAGLEIPEIAAAAHQRLNAAMRAIGPENCGLLIDVCCLLTGLEDIERKKSWPRRSAKLMLQNALLALARHYGLVPSAPDSVVSVIRHWAGPGYKPVVAPALGGE